MSKSNDDILSDFSEVDKNIDLESGNTENEDSFKQAGKTEDTDPLTIVGDKKDDGNNSNINANLNSSVEAKDNSPSIGSSNEEIVILQEIDNLDEKSLIMKLENMKTEELNSIFSDLKKTNHYLLKENEVYDFILNEDENVRDTLDSIDDDEDQIQQHTDAFSYPLKCYFAEMKIDCIKKELDAEKSLHENEIQNLKFKLESLNTSIKDQKEAKAKFDREIRIGGRHPVTKKVLLQKVAKYFSDSIQNKMALTNRYKIQAQSDTLERNKILNQIKAQEKRLASLDMTEYQKTQFEYTKSCRELSMLKEQLGKFKMKFSPLLQHITDMKRNLEKEEVEMERMKNAVSKLERLKEVMINEKIRNDEKVSELKSEMRKIKLDPRRHNLPEVIDYAAVKKGSVALKKEIDKWRNKVELAKQEKALYLKALANRKL